MVNISEFQEIFQGALYNCDLIFKYTEYFFSLETNPSLNDGSKKFKFKHFIKKTLQLIHLIV